MDQIANVATTAGVYYIVALALFMMLSVMGVVNMAHGAFLTIGGYVVVTALGRGLPFVVSLPLALVVGAGMGIVIERLIIRRLYARPLDTILATWGVAIVIAQLIGIAFTRQGQYVPMPFADTPISILGTDIAAYRVAILIVAVLTHVALVVLTRSTYVGVIARAVVMNPGLARALGINTSAVNLVTFTVACAVAAFAGALIAPLGSVDPNLGFPYIIVSFMVVLVAGVSLSGLLLSAFVIALGTSLASYYFSTVVGVFVLVLLPVLVLRLRPEGFATVSFEGLTKRLRMVRSRS